jgi:hypothetical protein
MASIDTVVKKFFLYNQYQVKNFSWKTIDRTRFVAFSYVTKNLSNET